MNKPQVFSNVLSYILIIGLIVLTFFNATQVTILEFTKDSDLNTIAELKAEQVRMKRAIDNCWTLSLSNQEVSNLLAAELQKQGILSSDLAGKLAKLTQKVNENEKVLNLMATGSETKPYQKVRK